MIKLILTQGVHGNTINKFCRLLEKFNPNITQVLKASIKNGFNPRIDERGHVIGCVCSTCGQHYKKIGWAVKHQC